MSSSNVSYECYLTVDNLPGNDNAVEILGQHAQGMSHADVTVVYMVRIILNFKTWTLISKMRIFGHLQVKDPKDPGSCGVSKPCSIMTKK